MPAPEEAFFIRPLSRVASRSTFKKEPGLSGEEPKPKWLDYFFLACVSCMCLVRWVCISITLQGRFARWEINYYPVPGGACAFTLLASIHEVKSLLSTVNL